MDEELKKAIADMLGDIRNAVSAGGDFVLEQAPLVVQEYVEYIRIVSTMQVACGVIGLVAILLAYRYWWWPFTEKAFDGDDLFGSRVVGGLVAFGLSIACVIGICRVDTCIMAWVAPRVLILEKMKELLQ